MAKRIFDEEKKLSIDFNAFSLENNDDFDDLSLTSINAMACAFRNDVAAGRKRYKELRSYTRIAIHYGKSTGDFHALLLELNIDLLPYDSSNGFPLHYENDDVISSKYQLSWDNFWLYWDTFKDYDMNLLLDTFNSFRGTFKSQFCSSQLHYSHPVEQQEDINQAMDALNMNRQKKPKMVTISLSNSEEAPPHDSVFIEKHILDKIIQEDPERNDGS